MQRLFYPLGRCPSPACSGSCYFLNPSALKILRLRATIGEASMNPNTSVCDHVVRREGNRYAPISERVCDFACVAFALWTICCHGVVALGGSLHDLLATFAVAVVATVAVGSFIRRRRGSGNHEVPPVDTPADRDAQRPGCGGYLMIVVRAVGALAVAVTLLAYVKTHEVLLLWWGSVSVLVMACVAAFATRREPHPIRSCRQSRLSEAALWTVGLLCVALALISHRPSFDDAFYVNVAVTACDFPDRPLMLDGMHGIEGLALHMPAHRVHSFEVLNGAVSYLAGIPAMYVYHWITAGLAACLVPLAFASLFRTLTPTFWLWSVVAVLVVLMGAADAHRWYGNFALVRMWQGKSVYLSVFLPLAYAYGLRFGAAPTLRGWLLLAAVQISAVGCTSSALWSVPMGVCLAVACGVRPGRGALKILALAVLSSAYVVAVGLTLKGVMGTTADRVEAVTEDGSRLATALVTVLGHGKLKYFAIGSMLACWMLYRKGPVLRFASLVPAVILLVALNPYAEELVSRNLTGPSHWRAMWALPIPMLMALLLVAPLQFGQSRVARAGTAVAVFLAMVSFLLNIPRISALSTENNTHIETPRLKVSPDLYSTAESLCNHVAPGARVVTPQKVALLLPTFHHHPYPLVVRKPYLQAIEKRFGAEEIQLRLLMTEVVSGKDDVERSIPESPGFGLRAELADAVPLFRDGLERFRIEAVCLSRFSEHYRSLQTALGWSDFVLKESLARYEIWVRSRYADQILDRLRTNLEDPRFRKLYKGILFPLESSDSQNRADETEDPDLGEQHDTDRHN